MRIVAEVPRVKRTTALDYMRRGVIPACKIGQRWYSAQSTSFSLPQTVRTGEELTF